MTALREALYTIGRTECDLLDPPPLIALTDWVARVEGTAPVEIAAWLDRRSARHEIPRSAVEAVDVSIESVSIARAPRRWPRRRRAVLQVALKAYIVVGGTRAFELPVVCMLRQGDALHVRLPDPIASLS